MRKRSGFGWMELIVGILLVLLGIFSFVRPNGILTGIVIIYGLVAVITGISDIVFYVRVDRHIGFGPTVALVSGVLSVMSGVMLLTYPGAGKWILSLLFPIWFITHCISRISHLGFVRRTAGNLPYYLFLILNRTTARRYDGVSAAYLSLVRNLYNWILFNTVGSGEYCYRF